MNSALTANQLFKRCASLKKFFNQKPAIAPSLRQFLGLCATMIATRLLEEYSLPRAVLLFTVAMKGNDQGKASWGQNATDLTAAKAVSEKWICLTSPIQWSMAYPLELSHSCCLSFSLFSKLEFLFWLLSSSCTIVSQMGWKWLNQSQCPQRSES